MFLDLVLDEEEKLVAKVAEDMAGSTLCLLFELGTLSASLCGSADGQDAIISVEVRDAGVGPAVGRSSQRVLGAGYVYNG